MAKPLLDPKKQYTFSDYFNMNVPVNELLAYFGYSYQKTEQFSWPKANLEAGYWVNFKSELRQNIRFTLLNNETARRESLIAPILLKIAIYVETLLKMEYPLRVNKQLGGKIDYYMQRENNLLIIEAKQADLTGGFTQLAVELIALDKWLDPDNKPLYGCVSIGDIWRFGLLNRQTKLITEDMYVYQVPANLEELLAILIGILQGDNESA